MSEPKTMTDVRNDPAHIRAVAIGVKILDDTEGCPIAKEAHATMMDNASNIERLRGILVECKDKAFIRKFPGDEQLWKKIETGLNQPSPECDT